MEIPLFTLKRQNKTIRAEILKAIENVVDSGIYSNGGRTRDFEEAWANYTGAKYCVFCASGTSALEIALKALACCDFVVTTANSFMATASAITAANSEPIFIDTDDTCNLDIAKLKDNYLTRIGFDVILPVNLYGNSIDLQKLKKETSRKTKIVLDAAQSHGCDYKGKPFTDFVDLCCGSFYTTKSLGCFGESGYITTNNKKLYQKLLSLRNHGRDEDGYNHVYLSGNHRGDEIQAAILLTKLKHFDEHAAKRIAIYNRYVKNFIGENGIDFLKIDPESRWVPYLCPVFVGNRDKVKQKMIEVGVSCGVHYPIALPMQKCYKSYNFRAKDFPNAIKQCNTELSLPFFPELTSDEVDFVSEQLIKVCKNSA